MEKTTANSLTIDDIVTALESMMGNPRRRDSVLRRLSVDQLKQLSASSTEALRQRIEEENRRRADEEMKTVKAAEALALLEKQGLTIDDLNRALAQGVKNGGRPAKYKFKDQYGQWQSWTGQGRTPAPIQQGLSDGYVLDDFVIGNPNHPHESVPATGSETPPGL